MTSNIFLGPFIKGVALTYLSYMTVFKNANVPIWFFIAHGVGSLTFLVHLKRLKRLDSDDIVQAETYDQYFDIGLCLFMILFILQKKY